MQDDGPGIDDAYRDSVFEYGYTTEGTRFVFHTSLEPSLSSDGAVTPPPPRT